MTEECRSCHRAIDWAYAEPDSDQGHVKTNPIDHDSADDPKGNLAVWRDDTGVLRYRHLPKGQDPALGEHRGISHFATCPDREQWRRRRS